VELVARLPPRSAVLAALTAVLLGLVIGRGDHDRAFELVAFLGVLGAVAYLIWRVNPAWPLSAGLALTIFSGNWEHLGVPMPLDRVLLASGALIALLRGGQAGARSLLRGRRAVHWALLVAALWAIGSALWVGTLTNAPSYYRLLDQFGILPFLMFAVAPLAFRTARQRAILLGTLVATGAYLGLTALFEAVGPEALVWPRYILDSTIGIHADRARGPFLEAGANGLALFFCATGAAVAVATWRRPILRLAAGLIAGLDLLGILFTLTRANWIAAPVAALAVGLIVPRLRRYVLPTAAAAAATLAVVLALLPGVAGKAEQRKNTQLSLWDRANTDQAALRMIGAHPLLGFGWDTFHENSASYFEQSDSYPITGVGLLVHNVFLSYGAELGLVGVTLWGIAFTLAIGGSILRRGPPELLAWRFGLIAIAINWIVVANFTPLTYALPNLLLWTWAGLVAARPKVDDLPAGDDPPGDSGPHVPPRSTPPPARAPGPVPSAASRPARSRIRRHPHGPRSDRGRSVPIR
jgi:O-antigen ligase